MSYDIYLKLEGIDGECSDTLHLKWIELVKYSWGVEQRGGQHSADAEATGRVSFLTLRVSKYVDASSPNLFTACITHQLIKTATLEFGQATKDKHIYMRVRFRDVVIAAVHPGGGGNEPAAAPLEEIELRYSYFEFEFIPLDKDGKPQAARKMSASVGSAR